MSKTTDAIKEKFKSYPVKYFQESDAFYIDQLKESKVFDELPSALDSMLACIISKCKVGD